MLAYSDSRSTGNLSHHPADQPQHKPTKPETFTDPASLNSTTHRHHFQTPSTQARTDGRVVSYASVPRFVWSFLTSRLPEKQVSGSSGELKGPGIETLYPSQSRRAEPRNLVSWNIKLKVKPLTLEKTVEQSSTLPNHGPVNIWKESCFKSTSVGELGGFVRFAPIDIDNDPLDNESCCITL